MDPSWLNWLQPYVQIDVRFAYRQFRTGCPSEDPVRFLGHLYQQGHLDQQAYYALYGYFTGTGSQSAHALRQPGTERRGRFEVGELLGEGGMGAVYRARDLTLGRAIAYKQLRLDTGVDGLAARFVDEARITAQLDHPGVVPVHTLEVESNGSMAMTMKLVEGVTLEDYIEGCRRRLLAGEPLAPEQQLPQRLEYFLRVADAIAYAHHKGVVHRDLKPANIMIGRWQEVYVMDWGLARPMGQRQPDADSVVLAGSERHTLTGQAVGTPRYMSPEQAEGRNDELDERSDLYSLGIILQELVCLQPAVPGNSVAETMKNVLGGVRNPIEPLPGAEPVGRELRAIIAKASARRIEDRYTDVPAFADDLRRYLRGEPVQAAPDNVFQALARWGGRHRGLMMSLATGFALLTAAVVIWSLSNQIAAKRREQALNRFHSRVAGQAHRIDRAFQGLESGLRTFAALAEHVLTHSEEASGARYRSRDFESEQTAPPDLAFSPIYGKKVSIGWPVFKLAPGVPDDPIPPPVAAQIGRLYLLRGRLQRLLVESVPGGAAIRQPVAVRQLLLERGVPIRWAYVGLASGVMFSYPGKGGYPPDYDPRKRPWYRAGVASEGSHWAPPYLDLHGQGLILPCVAPLFDPQHRLLGVAGIEITLDYVVAHLLETDAPGVLDTLLLDAQGRVVVRSRDEGKPLRLDAEGVSVRLEPFEIAPVREAARRGESGLAEVQTGFGRSRIAYYRLPTLGWSYVVWADADTVESDDLRQPGS
ncbi:MAG: hypothetical protein D6776_01805 [Planctomycetota bacterium]|nr:MAG: hypothetical protein D6776_01805 [Planctomycetota bacterium]